MDSPLAHALMQAVQQHQLLLPPEAVPPLAPTQNPLTQLAMMPEEERRNPRPGRMPQELAGGGASPQQGPPSLKPKRTPAEPPKALEDVIYKWAQGKTKPGEVQKTFKEHGWSVDLRRGRSWSDVEVFDPNGVQGFIQP